MSKKINLQNLNYYTPNWNYPEQKILVSLDLLSKLNPNSSGISIRMGGTTMCVKKWTFSTNDGFQFTNDSKCFRTQNAGLDYLDELERIVKTESNANYIGIAVAGPVSDGNYKPTNLPLFREKFDEKYNSNFYRLFNNFPNTVVLNDAVSVMLYCIYNQISSNNELHNSIVQILGTGNGFAVFKKESETEGYIYPTEFGQIQAGDINKFDEIKPSIHNPNYVSIENVIAGPGIERAYHRMTGNLLKGKIIDMKTQEGDEIALRIIENSALGAAQGFAGVAEFFQILHESTFFYGHGGVWNSLAGRFKNKVQEILKDYAKFNPEMKLTIKNEEDDPDIIGAALYSMIK